MGLRFILGLDMCRVRETIIPLIFCYRGRKFCPASPGPQVLEYGGFSKINDTIGVMIEFNNGIGQVSFYRNGVRLPTAGSSLI
jgi:hypothetical protein